MSRNIVKYDLKIAQKMKGTDKSRWLPAGVIIETPSGKLYGNINCVPITGWDGSFYIFQHHDKGIEQPGADEVDVDTPPTI